MGKLEKAIKIHMVYGLIFFLLLLIPYNGYAAILYPLINIVYWTWALLQFLIYGYGRGPHRWIWLFVIPIAVIHMVYGLLFIIPPFFFYLFYAPYFWFSSRWCSMAFSTIVAMGILEWNTLMFLKNKKRTLQKQWSKF